MDLQGNRNVETESNREGKQSSSEQDQLNLIDFDPYDTDDESPSLDYKDLSGKKFQQPQDLRDKKDLHDNNLYGPSDRDLLLPQVLSPNLVYDPREFGYTKLSLDSQELSDEEPLIDPNHQMSPGDRKVPQNLKEFSNENVSHKPNAPADENVEQQHCRSLIDENLFNDAKSSILYDDTFLKHPTYVSNSHEPIKIRGQELSLEEKAKHLRDTFKGIPLSTIRNILQRDDVQEDLNAAINCLKAISASGGTSILGQKGDTNGTSKRKKLERQFIPSKIKQGDGFGIVNKSEEHKETEPEDSSKCEVIKTPLIQGKPASDVSSYSDGQNKQGGEQDTPLNLEAKIKNLQGKFNIPPLMIKIVLQRSDVEEDLVAASKCLNGMCQSSTEGLQRSRQETLGTNNVNKRKPPPVLPKKTKTSVKNDVDNGKRAYNNGITGLKIQNAKKPEGSESTVKQKQKNEFHHEELDNKQRNHVSNMSSPEEMDSCLSELRGKKNAKHVPNFEQNIILIKGLSKYTSYETILNFAESKMKEQVLKIVMLDDKTSALVKFGAMRDFNNGKERMERFSLEGVNVTVHRVPVSSSILVRNLAFNTTRDSLEYFFANPRIGGEVSSIQYEEGDEQAVVMFKDPDVMKKVLSLKSLTLNDAALQVELFIPFTQEITRDKHSQHKIALSVDKNVMEFISATGSLSELKESLRDQGFTMTYTSGCSFVYVTPKRATSINRERGIKIVTDFTMKFKAIELDVDKNHWDAIMIEISKLYNEIGKDKLLVKVCTSSKDKVIIICREPDSKELKKSFMDKIAETQSLEDTKAYVIDTIDIEKEKLRLLKVTGYKETLVNKYLADLKFDIIDEANGKVTIAGSRQRCYEAKVKIYQELSKFCEKIISLSEPVIEMLDVKELELLLRTKQIYAVFHINEGNIFVLGINKKNADQASDLVKSLISEVSIEVNQEGKDIIKTQKWIDFCMNVSQEFKVCVRIEDNFGMWITGIKENVSRAEEKMKTILEKQRDELVKIETERPVTISISADEKKDREVKGESAHVEHGLEPLADSVATDETKVEQHGLHKLVTSEKEEEKKEKVVIGAGAHSRESLQDLADSVIRDKKKVKLPGLHKSVNVDGQNENKKGTEKAENAPQSERSKELQSNDMSLNTTSSNGSSGASTQAGYSGASASAGTKSEKCGNVTISWKQGNIVTEHVSVQVGSTMGKLYDIFIKAGGPEFSNEVMKLYKSSSQVIINSPGNLPCNHVILVSCCRWDGANGEAERKLRSILRECLQQALKLNATSIAFPIIGTGGLGFPYDTACHIMIDEVINITSRWGPASLNDIRFVVFAQDAKLIDAFQQEFTLAFDKTSGREVSGRGTFSQLMSLRMLHRSSGTTGTNTLGKLSVEVLQGDLINETTDAIVNINATDMNMQNAGALSKAVAAAAGPALQTKCTSLGKQTAGSAVLTGAGKLKAKHIIHMIPGEATVQHIQKCIEKCLQAAENFRFKSISIPACGTGGLKMSASDSAQATFQALANVCLGFKHLKQIRIVIFQPHLLLAFKARLLTMELDHQLKLKAR